MTNEELVEEVKRYYSDNFEYLSSDQPTLSILTNIARHFTDWQKEQMMKEGDVILAEEDFDAEKEKSMERGYNLCKEQMMKKAVEGEYGYFSNASKTILPSGKLNLKEGDKVRIIIVKE